MKKLLFIVLIALTIVSNVIAQQSDKRYIDATSTALLSISGAVDTSDNVITLEDDWDLIGYQAYAYPTRSGSGDMDSLCTVSIWGNYASPGATASATWISLHTDTTVTASTNNTGTRTNNYFYKDALESTYSFGVWDPVVRFSFLHKGATGDSVSCTIKLFYRKK
jgi:hypothetical protein